MYILKLYIQWKTEKHPTIILYINIYFDKNIKNKFTKNLSIVGNEYFSK